MVTPGRSISLKKDFDAGFTGGYDNKAGATEVVSANVERLGYGDVLLNQHYRMLGGIEALAGVMMMSWSTAILIAYLQRVYAPLFDRWGRRSSGK